MGSVPFTTERFYMDHADKHGEDCLKRHVNRYKWAASCLEEGDAVLDVGCGSGYGDAILMGKASSVVGVDKEKEAIDYAKNALRERKENRIRYIQKDILHGIAADGFSAAVCLEMIEHVDREDQMIVLNNIYLALNPGGLLLISTPRKGTEALTEFHKHELTREDFVDVLETSGFKVEGMDDPAQFGVPLSFMLARCRRPK